MKQLQRERSLRPSAAQPSAYHHITIHQRNLCAINYIIPKPPPPSVPPGRYSNISFQLAISLSHSLSAKSLLGLRAAWPASMKSAAWREKRKRPSSLSYRLAGGYHFSFLLPFISPQEFTASILAGLPVDGGNEI